MPGTGQMLMGPSALAKAIAIPYSSERLWQTGEYCTHEGRVYQFTGETLLAGEAWDPTHWQEKIVIDELVKKADKVTSATSGNFASLDANGNLADSGHKHDDYLTSHQDISGKQDKTDNTLDTTSKTVVGAINEHEGDISGANQAIAGIATVITGTTNNSGHSISSGEYFIANGAKYKASATIGTGVTWADKATSVSDHDLINALNSKITNLNNTVDAVHVGDCQTFQEIYDTISASGKNTGYGEIGDAQTSQLKSSGIITNPFYNYTTAAFIIMSKNRMMIIVNNDYGAEIKTAYVAKNGYSTWNVTSWMG